MKPFLALITPIGETGDAHPEHPIVIPPPGEQPPTYPPWWPGHPAHPIPPGIWPSPPQPQPPQSPGTPTHPIVLPGDPSWGPPLHPAHPIAPGGGPPVDPGYGYPSRPVDPGYGYPWVPKPPTGIWPGPGPLPGIEHPINKPPSEAPPGYDWSLEYLPARGGWVWVLVPETKSQEPSK